MPLTAYSKSLAIEVDFDQYRRLLSEQFRERLPQVGKLPDHWRQHIQQDLECPCCFVTGAELVKEVEAMAGLRKRQAFFRFTKPGHQEHCDFAHAESTNAAPENLVAFGESRSSLTRAVRDLVCAGIALEIFSQQKIREMRKWFFDTKVQSLFLVSLDPRVPSWLLALANITYQAKHALPSEVRLTHGIATLPGFRWKLEAARRLLERYPLEVQKLEQVRKRSVVGDFRKVAELAKRHHGRKVFDPTVLKAEYGQTLALARFIAGNYKPLRTAAQKWPDPNVPSLLALSALLLYVRRWDLEGAISDFVRIASVAGTVSHDLGNVMGLNPFHDFPTWEALKTVQEADIPIPGKFDLEAEWDELEVELRAQYAVGGSSSEDAPD